MIFGAKERPRFEMKNVFRDEFSIMRNEEFTRFWNEAL